jgi:hypothetical protein
MHWHAAPKQMRPCFFLWGLFVATAVAAGPLRISVAIDPANWPLRPISLAGEVVVERGNLPADVQLELRPVLTGWFSGDLRALERSYALLRRTTRPTRDGAFSFTGLTPGSFVVRATAKGLAAETPDPIVLVEDQPAPLVRLALQQDAEVRLQITPPLDGEGHPWIVGLDRWFGDRMEGAADINGKWLRSGLLPGGYALDVRKDHGIHACEHRQLRVIPGMPTVFIEFHSVAIEGRVTRTGEPVRAAILFRGEDQRLVSWLESADDGSFSGDLPHPGRWVIEIVDWKRSARREVQELEVRPNAGLQRAHVELRLPAASAAEPPR